MSLAACAPTGDFGRAPTTSLYNDTAMPLAGKVTALARQEPVTFLPLTDNETVLRSRVYTIVVARDILGEAQSVKPYLRYHNVVRPWPHTTPVNAYHDRILRIRFASSEARFNRVLSDMRKDIATIAPFEAAALQVMADDAIRQKVIASDPLAARTVAGAEARMIDNQRVIGLAVATLRHRVDVYAYALRHLAAETPTQRVKVLEAAYHDFYQSVIRLERRFEDPVLVARRTKDGDPLVLSEPWVVAQPAGEQPNSLANPR